jgi:hypothetical protein
MLAAEISNANFLAALSHSPISYLRTMATNPVPSGRVAAAWTHKLLAPGAVGVILESVGTKNIPPTL